MSRRVTYDEALALKTIGYKEASDAFYILGNKKIQYAVIDDDKLSIIRHNGDSPTVNLFQRMYNRDDDKITAPTLDDVLDWAEKKYDIKLSIIYNKDDKCYESGYWHKDLKIEGKGFLHETRDEAKARLFNGIIHIAHRLK